MLENLARFMRLPRPLWDLDSFADLKLEDEAESEERFDDLLLKVDLAVERVLKLSLVLKCTRLILHLAGIRQKMELKIILERSTNEKIHYNALEKCFALIKFYLHSQYPRSLFKSINLITIQTNF